MSALLAILLLPLQGAPPETGNLQVALSAGPEEAPVVIVEFADFECPYCAQSAPVIRELLSAFPNKIRFIYKSNPLPGHANAPLAHEAALAAAEQGKFWEMHDLLYANSRNLKKDDLLGYARKLNLNMTAFSEALETRPHRKLIEQDALEARALGVTATPTFYVNGMKLVGAQTLVALKAVVTELLTPPPGVSSVERVQTLSGAVQTIRTERAPRRGPGNALVSIVEFSDFQCPYCAKAVGILHEIEKQYPDKVKISFKHFPLSFHRNAPLAHQAALAAAQQGKFWEMHDWIFAHQSTMERQDLIKGAGEIGLDVPKFTADIDSGAYKAIIDSDREEGLGLGVDGTPTFFINGHKVQNAGSVAEFRNWIEDALVLAPPSDTETGRATDAALTRGPAGAPVQIVWYSDLASPLTTRASELIHQILAAYPGQVQVVFRNFPQPVAHPAAKLAHEAAMAAAEHGKFWEMAACVAGRQELSVADVDACAGQTGIDLKRFASSLSAGAYRPAIERDLAEAERLRVKGSPVFFVNGKRIDGLQQLPIFKVFIDADLKQPGVGGQ